MLFENYIITINKNNNLNNLLLPIKTIINKIK